MVIFTQDERKQLNEELEKIRVPFMLNRVIQTQCSRTNESIEVGHSEVTLVKVALMPVNDPNTETPIEWFFFKTKEGNVFWLPENSALNLCVGMKEIVNRLTTQFESRAFQKAGELTAIAKQKAEALDKAVVENSINEQSLNNWGNW